MRCSYKLSSAVPTACKNVCLSTRSKRLLGGTQAEELGAHCKKDCSCPPAQSGLSCEVLENLAHRIYQPSWWNESHFPAALLTQSVDALRHNLAFGTRTHSILYTQPLASEDQEEQPFLSHVTHSASFFSTPYSFNTRGGAMEKGYKCCQAQHVS